MLLKLRDHPLMRSQPLGAGGQGFCDDCNRALVLKSVTMG